MHEHQASIIQSAGAPPERHADRIIAAMLRDLAKQRATIGPAIAKAIIQSKDGGERAQRRMVERIRAAGAVDVSLRPQKRGRYELMIQELIGWDPVRNDEIGPNDPIPPKPWVAVFITSRERCGKIKAAPLLFITHHCLSRCAQRFGLRTSEQIIIISRAIWNGLMSSNLTAEQINSSPPAGHRILIAETGITVVLRKHEKRVGLVAATMLFGEGDTNQ